MKNTSLAVCAGFLLAAATPAFATLTVDSANRQVELQNAPNGDSDINATTSGNYTNSISDSGGSDNTETQGEASQNTDILPLIFGGSGHAFVETHTGSPNDVFAGSIYLVTFTIDQDYLWVTSGTLSQIVDGGSSIAYAEFIDITNATDIFLKTTGSFSDISDSGTIGPGQYTIVFNASAFGSNGGNAFAGADFENATLTLRPLEIPEPASLGILALGAATAFLRRKRRV